MFKKIALELFGRKLGKSCLKWKHRLAGDCFVGSGIRKRLKKHNLMS